MVPFFLRGMQADGRGQGWSGRFAYVLTAAVPDGFLMRPTHDPEEVVSRPAASAPTRTSHPAETRVKTLINQKNKHEKRGPVFPVCSAAVCVCVQCVVPPCLVDLFVRCFEIATRSSNIWSALKGLHRSTPSSTAWRGAIF